MSRSWKAAVALVLVLAGCATIQARNRRQDYLRTQLNALRYPQPMDELWQDVRRFLVDQGYPLVGADAVAVGKGENMIRDFFSPGRASWSEGGGNRALETGWGEARRRYRADALVDAKGVRVVFTAIDEDLTTSRGEVRDRDLDMELDLARRLAPADADRIEAGLAEAAKGG